MSVHKILLLLRVGLDKLDLMALFLSHIHLWFTNTRGETSQAESLNKPSSSELDLLMETISSGVFIAYVVTYIYPQARCLPT